MSLDLAIIGGGSAGYAAALRASQLGLKVALVEAGEVGGTCLHRGCIPTKALLQAAATADTVRSAAGFGISATLDGIDAAAIVAYQQQVVTRMHRGLTELLKAAQVPIYKGIGRLSNSPLGVTVGDDFLAARHVVLATGATPVTLGLPIDGQRVITSDHALTLEALPESAIIVGGGVIGVEFASAWASLGVSVTLVEATERLVPQEDPAISKELRTALSKRGIKIRLGTAVGEVEVTDSQVRVQIGADQLSADVLLVAVGRRANPESGGAPDLRVNPDLSTNIANVYVAGDLAPGPQLAHRGYLQGRYVATLIAHQVGKAEAPTLTPDHLIPKVTYSSPQIVSVGLTAAQSKQHGETQTVDYPFTGSGMAQIHAGGQRTRGFLRLVMRPDVGIVGVHAIGEGVAELAGEAALLVGWEALPSDLINIAHAHPSLGEAFQEVALALAGQHLHMRPSPLG